MGKSELIIALDFGSAEEALSLVGKVGEAGTFYKVGLELFIACGRSLLPSLKDLGKKVFLDLKIHDIPNTCAGAVKSCLKLGADIIDLHTQGGLQMLAAAAETVGEYPGAKPLLVGVTLLTSLDEKHLLETGVSKSCEEYVLTLASLAKKAGLNGVVASVREAKAVKASLGQDFITVTPGIRPKTGETADQLRTATPEEARAAGCDYIVVGRPITQNPDPKRAAAEINYLLQNER